MAFQLMCGNPPWSTSRCGNSINQFHLLGQGGENTPSRETQQEGHLKVVMKVPKGGIRRLDPRTCNNNHGNTSTDCIWCI